MNRALYLRNVIFGVEDSLVSTVGLLCGIDLGHVPTSTILYTGIVYIFVEAFSMAIGSFLSEESVEEYEQNGGGAGVSQNGSIDSVRTTAGGTTHMNPALGAVAMFVSFVIAGFVPLLPYLWLSGAAVLAVSIAVSLAALAVLGYASAVFSRALPWKRVVRMLVLGGAAIAIGAVVSVFVKAA